MTDVRTTFQDVLGDRYRLEGEIGTGGQAAVFRARDMRLGRTVAVKFLRPDLAPFIGPERFQREIAIAAALAHPNIVPLLDSGGAGQHLYYTMPLVEGESLRARLRREPQLPFEEALAIVRDVAAALDHAHAHNFVHRDIKPDNILLTGDRAVVLDFGIARAIEVAGDERVTSQSVALGTPPYMSPEQSTGAPQVDGRADIYALGCVAYEMLGGLPPFTGATPQAIFARSRVEPPPSLAVIRPTVTAALEEAIGKALAKVPADRYRTAAEFVAALERSQRWPGGRAAILRRVRRGASIALPAAAAIAAWALWPRMTLDPNKVMGFPLVAQGGVAPFVVEQVEEAIAAAMQDTDPLRWLRARLFLGAAARPGIPADSATRLARQRGARYWLGGSLSILGDSVMVRLDLFDAQGDSLVYSRAETGPRIVPAYALAFRAVNALLPRIVGRSTHVDETYLERHPPAAVAKWLEGEVAYRNERFVDAMRFYREALALDSSLVAAALKAAMTAAWLVEYDVGDSLVRLALRRESALPPLNRMFARGLLHQFAGNGDSAYYWFRAVVRAAPDWSEGWYGVGEAAFHLWPRGDNLDSVARDAFQRSVDLDPDFAPVVFHLAELTIIAGNLDTAARLVERHRQLGEDPVQQLELDVMLRCLRRGADAVDWGAIASAEKAADQVLIAGRLLSAGGRHLTCAEAAYRAALLSPAPDEDLSRRWNAALGLHHLFVARGEHERAIRLADSLVTGGIPAGRGLRILDAILAVGPDSAGAAEIAALAMPLDSSSLARLWWFGEWAAHMRDTTRLAAVAAQLDRRAAFSARLGDSLVARLMRARLVLFRGDTAAAIDSLRALRAVDPLPSQVWRYWEALAPERLLLARLLLARGRPEEALRVAETFDGQRTVVDLAFLPQSLELRADAAERLGDRDRGAEYRRRLGAMRGR